MAVSMVLSSVCADHCVCHLCAGHHCPQIQRSFLCIQASGSRCNAQCPQVTPQSPPPRSCPLGGTIESTSFGDPTLQVTHFPLIPPKPKSHSFLPLGDPGFLPKAWTFQIKSLLEGVSQVTLLPLPPLLFFLVKRKFVGQAPGDKRSQALGAATDNLPHGGGGRRVSFHSYVGFSGDIN